MDPITGIGLVASVIQLVTFSIDAVKVCREVYQQGSVSEYSDLDYTTGQLAGLTDSLQQSLHKTPTASLAHTREDRDLIEIAQKCQDCANRLQKELRTLQTQPRASARQTTRQAFRAVWKRSSVNKIYRQLQTHQSTLETSLLSRLSRRFDTQGLRNDKCFTDIDSNLQHLITCLANAQTSLSELVIHQSEQTRDLVSTQIDRLERLHVDNRRYQEIIDSLFYPDISSRQEQVDSQFDGIKDSYDWIFDEPYSRVLGSFDWSSLNPAARWDDFAGWLKSGHGVYWIKGKAGSGKSTLMNHICNHSRRLELLGEWQSQRRLLTPTFFFWSAGNRLQKSIDGLLRSLIYQILKDCRELIEYFSNEPLYTWTQSRLQSTLLNLLKQSQVPVAICMFIDGLDEFDGPDDIVVDMMKDLANQTHVKVCVSSRPLLAFEEAFTGKPSLRLQDLTFDSMRKYAAVKLSDQIQKYISVNNKDLDQTRSYIDWIVQRAEGVFLWVVIAVRVLREGLRGIASLPELAQTIEALPSEVESLFMHMLNNIKPVFKRDAAKFLEMTLYGHGQWLWDLCTLHLSHSQSELSDGPFVYDTFHTKDLVTDCETLETRLKSHTAGLLELTPYPIGNRIYGKRKDLDPVLSTGVNFLHRAVRDFLLNNNEAKSFLARNGPGEAQVRLSLVRGTLVSLAHFSRGDPKCNDYEWLNPVYYHPFCQSLQHIAIAERILGVAQARLMQSLHYEFFAQGYPVAERPGYWLELRRSFMKTASGHAIDQVSMAAAVGMTFYVCEQLDLSVESRSYPCSFPNLSNYSKNKKSMTSLAWRQLHRYPSSDSNRVVGLHRSNYRQALGGCLRWEVDPQSNSRTQVTSEKHLLAESFLLSCCEPTCHDLARILLRAGANPMVQVKSEGSTLYFESFWEKWLKYLNRLCYSYLFANGRSRGIMFRHGGDKHDTSKDILDITKTLLAQGANINSHVPSVLDSLTDCYYTRNSHLNVKVTAMSILEECFNTEPEFRRFASEIEPLVETPTREIEIIWPGGGINGLFHGRITHLEPEETEMLWPLIANWERGEDREALRAAIEDVWRVHNPGVKLKKGFIDWSDIDNEDDNDSDESDDSDNEDDNDNDESDSSGESDIDKNDSTA